MLAKARLLDLDPAINCHTNLPTIILIHMNKILQQAFLFEPDQFILSETLKLLLAGLEPIRNVAPSGPQYAVPVYISHKDAYGSFYSFLFLFNTLTFHWTFGIGLFNV